MSSPHKNDNASERTGATLTGYGGNMTFHTEWIALPSGSFWMGSEDFYPDEAPVRKVTVDAFTVSRTPVTNREFASFVDATGYLTVAERSPDGEREPGSLVFTPTAGPVDLTDWRAWWRWVPGASWRHPKGVAAGPPASALPEHPVVQVAYEDASTYAAWVGGRLPTEHEHEYASGGGSRPSPYAWGNSRDVDGTLMANTWRGKFPYMNRGANGWIGTSPVGSFPENGFGLLDTIGNVWEWTSTPYDVPVTPERGTSCACSPDAQPRGEEPETGPVRRVLKGGSHLCAPEYCLRYRPAARSPQSEDSATTHTGFRVVRDSVVRDLTD